MQHYTSQIITIQFTHFSLAELKFWQYCTRSALICWRYRISTNKPKVMRELLKAAISASHEGLLLAAADSSALTEQEEAGSHRCSCMHKTARPQ